MSADGIIKLHYYLESVTRSTVVRILPCLSLVINARRSQRREEPVWRELQHPPAHLVYEVDVASFVYCGTNDKCNRVCVCVFDQLLIALRCLCEYRVAALEIT